MDCDRCNVPMTLATTFEGSNTQAWLCPCCKSRHRTAEMIRADSERRATERGVTVEQLREEGYALIDKRPLSPAALEHMRADVRKRAAEWEPSCEHDTKNPWTS